MPLAESQRYPHYRPWKPTGYVDARVHIFTATALGWGRMASPTLGRLYPRGNPPVEWTPGPVQPAAKRLAAWATWPPVRRVLENRIGLKLLVKHQLLVYSDGVNMLENLQTFRENTEIFIKARKDISLEVNSEKIKYWSHPTKQNAVQNQNIVIEHVTYCLKMWKSSKDLGVTVKNDIREEIK